MEPERVEAELLDTTPIRISDADRDAVISRLQDAAGEGRIDFSEFEERARATYAARYDADLVPITADLPAVTAPAATSQSAPPGSNPRRRWFIQVMGGNDRTGNWDPGDQTLSLTVMGGQTLDLTEVTATRVEINAFTVMGATDIVVPKGAVVDLSGFILMGGTDNTAVGAGHSPMRVRIRSFGLMGGCSVRNLTKKEIAKQERRRNKLA